MELILKNVWLIPLFPLLAAILLGLGSFLLPKYIRNLRRVCSSVAILSSSVAMLIALHSFWQQITGGPAHRCLWSWVINGSIVLEIGYLIDPLTSILLILVTTVGVTVMIYSDSYMFYDQGYTRFFCYLSLFTASMLGLVPSPNLIQTYIFWELVGACSYLLIGSWFARPSAANACQKAFVTNRIGDFGLLLGILGLYWITGSFEFQDLFDRFFELLDHDEVSPVFASLCAILFFLGSVAKSAQFPLHIWLPDAMEGPTPISALIHAATMVAAGIFLVARMLPLFETLPFAMDVICWTGTITAALGASIALAQRDSKKGLAYSTMSQLGYMMLALGIGSYKAGLFHLVTHAYSKALLFLGSGSVIHSMEPIVGYHPNRSQNMYFMGGLREHMPITALTFLFGTLSLCGIPPFACFWSKDEILVDSWFHFPLLGFVASSTAGSTSFYMFRIYYSTFEGNFRGDFSNESRISYSIPVWGDSTFDRNGEETAPFLSIGNNRTLYPKESDNTMLLPSVILAIPTLFIGFVGIAIPQQIDPDFLSYWLHSSINSFNNRSSETILDFLSGATRSVSIASCGIAAAFHSYESNSLRTMIVAERTVIPRFMHSFSESIPPILRNWSHHRGYIDELYDSFFVKNFRLLVRFLSFIDQWIVDGVVNGIGVSSFLGGEGLKHTVGGRIPTYLFFLVSRTFMSSPYSYTIQTIFIHDNTFHAIVS
uniref:NADH dehydrogenase subunit 5 n=1 Tax=Moerckia flotoviana TaxID=71401 RepID=UPI00257EFE22|nr:NADH dehydrogenase subunit 5 [Moerckia flotoviana]WIA67342.1 NADH dehydrogenase subunit 5 [Moerckia flotoviana]